MKQETTLKEKTAKGLFWGGISNFVQQGVGAIFFIAIARILSPDDYGLIGMLAIFTAIANTILDSGFTVALINKKEIKHEDYNAVFWFSVFAGAGIYVILFFVAPLIAHFYGKPQLTGLSRLLFLSFLVGSFGFSQNAMLLKKLMIKERAISDMIAVFASGAIGLLLALAGLSYWGLAIQTVLLTSVGVAFRWYYSPWRPDFHISFRPIKSMIGFSSKLFITNVFSQISNNLFPVIIGRSYGERLTGIYSQGNKWMYLGQTVVSGMIASVTQPVFVEANEDKNRQLQIFRKILRFGAFVSFPIMFGLAFISKEFILITVKEKWIESVPILQMFCIFGGVAFLSEMYYRLLLSLGKSNIVMWYCIVLSGLTLGVAIVMSEYGIYAMTKVYVGLCVLGVLGWHFLAGKLIGLRLRYVLKDISPYLGITLGSIAVAWLLTQPIQNIYWLCISKIAIVMVLYLLIAKFSGSVLLKESMTFLTSRMKQK